MLGSKQSFISEVKVELQKASWPWEPKEKGMKKYKELTDSTLIVVIPTRLLAGYVGAWDFIMLNITKALTYLGKYSRTPAFMTEEQKHFHSSVVPRFTG